MMTIFGIAVIIGSIVPFLLRKSGRTAHAVAAISLLVIGLISIIASLQILLGNAVFSFSIPSLVPGVLGMTFAMDKLSAFFALIIGIISVLVAIYSNRYVHEYEETYAIGTLGALVNIFVVGMLGVVTASHTYSFLLMWEIMSVASYFLVTFEHRHEENIRAGFIYFITTHFATAALIAGFFIIGSRAGGYSFADFAARHTLLSAGAAAAAFIFFLIGTAGKMGLVPLHFWLPLAHPAAPSHVSGLMSGVMVKTAVYLLLRVVIQFLPVAPWMGYVVLAAALISAVLGALYALQQNDIKRLLAYSTIENIGIIMIGVSFGMIFSAGGHAGLATLAFTAALIHTLNHSIFKSGLFMGAGAMIHATHTRDLNKLGGLIRPLRYSALAIFIVVLAAAGLPFLNGFVGEWMTYQSMLGGFSIARSGLTLAIPLAIVGLALTAAIAATALVKFFGIAFLGIARSEEAKNAHEVSAWMIAPIAASSLLAVIFGIFPRLTIDLVMPAINSLGLPSSSFLSKNGSLHTSLGSFDPSILLVIVLICAAAMGAFVLSKKIALRKSIAWGCGGLGNHMNQYSSNAFAQPFLRMYNFIYRSKPVVEKTGPEYFPTAIHFRQSVKPLLGHLTDEILPNTLKRIAQTAGRLQAGLIQVYLLYVLLATIGVLLYITLFA